MDERKTKLVKKEYSGMGLIEAILAIAVAGIACLVFLSIAVQNTIEVSNLEKIDNLTKYAVRLSEQVKIIADKQNTQDVGLPRVFPALVPTNKGSCFHIEGSQADPKFQQNFPAICTVGNISGCRNSSLFSSREDFGVYCITDISSDFAIGKVVTGLVTCPLKGEAEVCPVPDYEYTVILRLK